MPTYRDLEESLGAMPEYSALLRCVSISRFQNALVLEHGDSGPLKGQLADSERPREGWLALQASR